MYWSKYALRDQEVLSNEDFDKVLKMIPDQSVKETLRKNFKGTLHFI